MVIISLFWSSLSIFLRISSPWPTFSYFRTLNPAFSRSDRQRCIFGLLSYVYQNMRFSDRQRCEACCMLTLKSSILTKSGYGIKFSSDSCLTGDFSEADFGTFPSSKSTISSSFCPFFTFSLFFQSR